MARIIVDMSRFDGLDNEGLLQEALKLWDELMEDQAANALALNALGMDIYYLRQELEQGGRGERGDQDQE